MAVWIDNLKRALREKEVVILHGNVRDVYVDREDGAIYRNLSDLLQYSLRTSASLLDQVIFYDRVDHIQGETPRRDNLTSPDRPNQRSNDLADYSAPVQRPSPQPVDLAQMLQDYRERLARPETRIALVFSHFDKTISRKTTYQSDDEEYILRVQKLIDEIKPPNRLILVALQDSMVPIELYTNAPRVRLVAVPLPDTNDRSYYLKHQLGTRFDQDLIDLAADLTDGLYLYDLQNIAAALKSVENLDSITVRELVNQYRVGFREDYFGKLPLDKLIRADRWFKEEAGVKGQDHAINKVSRVLWVARAGLAGESKPKAVLFFAGPSGVGKTFLARSLALFLFQSPENFIRFDMSEFKEEHTVSKLIGSPPGYVGFTEGGALTNAIRQRPFSVVLFDEVEKAHPKVLDIFLQILDEGRLSDSHGQTVFFNETIVVFTSNIGARDDKELEPGCSELDRIKRIKSECTGEERKQPLREHFIATVERYFMREISRPELLNRIGRSNIVPFDYIDAPETMAEIAQKHLQDESERFGRRHQREKWSVRFDTSVEQWLVDKHKEAIAEFGGRSIRNVIETEVIPELARAVLLAEKDGMRNMKFVIALRSGKITANVAQYDQ